MENTYVLHCRCAANERKAAVRRKGWTRLCGLACRCGIVLGFIAFIGIWAGAENGALLIGRRLLWTAADGILVFWLLRKEGGR